MSSGGIGGMESWRGVLKKALIRSNERRRIGERGGRRSEEGGWDWDIDGWVSAKELDRELVAV